MQRFTWPVPTPNGWTHAAMSSRADTTHSTVTEHSMRSAPTLLLLPVLFALVLAACGTDPVTPIISRPATIERSIDDGLTDDYVRLVEQGRKFLHMGHIELAEAYFEIAQGKWYLGVPAYRVWIELAEAKCRNGKMAEAFSVLADYDMAIKVDYGRESCGEKWRISLRTRSNPRMSTKVFMHLCSAEIAPFEPSVSDATPEEERQEYESQYQKLVVESAFLARRCDDILSTR